MTKNVIQSLTAAEMAKAESTAGLSLATLEDPNFPKVTLLGAIAWVYARRDDRDLTFDAYMEKVTLEEITESLGLNDEEGK